MSCGASSPEYDDDVDRADDDDNADHYDVDESADDVEGSSEKEGGNVDVKTQVQ
jgi:hypothetical protein